MSIQHIPCIHGCFYIFSEADDDAILHQAYDAYLIGQAENAIDQLNQPQTGAGVSREGMTLWGLFI